MMRALLCGLIAFWASLAVAQQKPTPEQLKQLKQLQKDATSHYQQQNYQAALSDFEAIFKIDPDPIYYYNIGLCQQNLNQKKEAQRSFHLFLDQTPKNHPNYAKAQERADALDQELGPMKTPRDPITVTEIKTWAVSRPPKVYYEAALVPGGAGLVLGVVSLKSAFALRDRVADSTLTQTDDFAHRMRVTALLSDVSLGLSAGLVFYGYLHSKATPPESQPAVTLTVTPFGASVARSF